MVEFTAIHSDPRERETPMEPTVRIGLLEREILFLYKMLASYGYFMGDVAPIAAPWRIFEGDLDALVVEEVEPWVRDGALLLALTVLWGVRDGAHSIDVGESARIAAMVEKLRPCSENTEEIAQAIDLIAYGEDENLLVRRSQNLYEKHVVGFLTTLAASAVESARPHDR
jgi:hypothetical protein